MPWRTGFVTPRERYCNWRNATLCQKMHRKQHMVEHINIPYSCTKCVCLFIKRNVSSFVLENVSDIRAGSNKTLSRRQFGTFTSD